MNHDDDLATALAFGDDLYFGDEPELDELPEPTAEELDAAADAEAAHYASLPDPYKTTGDKAVALLASHGVAASYEVDADADDDGRPRVESLIRVECRAGCGPVAHVHPGSLADSLSCEAPKGEESACARADEVLQAAGAYRDGWAR